tara:strand:+ start:118 stop:1098 length:981 start_codon:yes stop_codon:yes gene_type:complete
MERLEDILRKNYMVFWLEDFLWMGSNPAITLDALKNCLKQDLKIVLFHHEQIDLLHDKDNQIVTELQELVSQNKENICVLAHGQNKDFPFRYIDQNDFWIEVRDHNKGAPELTHTGPKPKDFLFLTGRGTANRDLLCRTLEENGCLENSLYTYNRGNGDERHLPDEYEHPDFHDVDWKKQNFYHTPALWKIVTPQFSDTKFSIVAETVERNNVYCLSEKIFKPIIAGHIFVVFAGAGYLTYLRSFGFKTFRDLFDEGYDDEVDTTLRIQKIVALCKKLEQKNHAELYEEARPILKHNRELFFDTQYLQSLNIETLRQIEEHFARKK